MSDPRLLALGGGRDDRRAPGVFLHGMLGDPSSFSELARGLDARRWWGVVLPGHGLDPWGCELGTWAEVVGALTNLLPPGGAHLVGYSLGARVALAIACAAPERVLSVVAIGATLGSTDPGKRAERAGLDRARAADVVRRGLAGFVTDWEALPTFSTQSLLPASSLDAQRACRLSHTDSGIAWAFEVLGQGSMPPLLPALTGSAVDMTLVAGALDPERISDARALENARPRTQVRVVPGVGHNVVLEAPEALERVIASSFESPGKSGELARDPRAGQGTLEGQRT